MAIRRMFSKRVIESASFLRMPPSTQALYFHLGMQADDDGIVEAFMVLRMVGASEDDLKLLHTKGFVYVLNDDLVTFIVDFRENNHLRADRKVDSLYQGLVLQALPGTEFLESKTRADLKPKAAADDEDIITDGQQTDNGQTLDVQRTDNGRPMDGQRTEEYRVVEDSTVERSTDQLRGVEGSSEEQPHQQENITVFVDFQKIVDTYNSKCPSLPKVKQLTSDRKQKLKILLSRFTEQQLMEVFEKAQSSALLRGERNGNGYEDFIAGFDWIIEIDNFVKILEGKYDSRGQPEDSGATYASMEEDLLDNY